MVDADGPALPPKKAYQNMEYAKSNLALAQNIQVSRAEPCGEAQFGPTANILSATRLPHSVCQFQRNLPTSVALGFASQPYDWFAFSRMMTLAGPLPRNYASAT